MRVISDVMPDAYKIEAIFNGECDVVFATNVTEREVLNEGSEEPSTEYVYDLFRIRHPYSEVLAEQIEADYEAWLEVAIDQILQKAKKEKAREVKGKCETTIYDGVDVETDFGVEHFSLSTHDQQNLSTIKMILAGGAEMYPYHAGGQPCALYSAEDLNRLIETATAHIVYHTTYCNLLCVWIARETDEDVVNGIYYGIDLPEDLAEYMNNLLH